VSVNRGPPVAEADDSTRDHQQVPDQRGDRDVFQPCRGAVTPGAQRRANDGYVKVDAADKKAGDREPYPDPTLPWTRQADTE
jgi:hypothetical protein